MKLLGRFFGVLIIVGLIVMAGFVSFPSYELTLASMLVIWFGVVLLSIMQFDIYRLQKTIDFHDEAIQILKTDKYNRAGYFDYDAMWKDLHNHYRNHRNSWNSLVRKVAREKMAEFYERSVENYLSQLEVN